MAAPFSNGVWSVLPCGQGTKHQLHGDFTLARMADFAVAPVNVPEPQRRSRWVPGLGKAWDLQPVGVSTKTPRIEAPTPSVIGAMNSGRTATEQPKRCSRSNFCTGFHRHGLPSGGSRGRGTLVALLLAAT